MTVTDEEAEEQTQIKPMVVHRKSVPANLPKSMTVKVQVKENTRRATYGYFKRERSATICGGVKSHDLFPKERTRSSIGLGASDVEEKYLKEKLRAQKSEVLLAK